MAIVSKFGGTSAKDGITLENVINNIILANPERKVIVFSAPGKASQDDIKVTDLLIRIGETNWNSREYPSDLIRQFRERFLTIADYLGLERSFLSYHFNLLDAFVKTEMDNRDAYLDSIKPFGEMITAKLVAEFLRKQGKKTGVYLPEEIGMITDGNFGKSKLLESSYQKITDKLKPVLERTDEIIIVPGFYGVDSRGRYTTFSRGGSDLTGAILANTVDAKLYENWTDTDGIRRADPRIIDNPDTIEKMTYREAREFAYSGAEVLHPDTLIPLIAKDIPLNVRNTFNLSNKGTYITTSKIPNGHVVEGVSHKEGFTVLYVEKTGMEDEIGYLNRLTNVLLNHGLSISQMTTSIDSVSVAMPANQINGKAEAVIGDIIKNKLADSEGVNMDYDKSMVCVVGEGMRHHVGVLTKLSGELASHGINIETVYQGPSERSIIFGLDSKDAKIAVKAIYDLYFGNRR
ncbi:aspartate kinase [Candidatus Woesearchaeota archaeon]|nr:aspartate kinase [Candidatus Woesearchaeota archaeon]